MEVDGWRADHLAREAARNVLVRGSRLFPLLVLSVLLGLGLVGYEVWETAQFERTLSELEARGRNIVVFQSSNSSLPAAISRDSCESLISQPDVLRAGAIVDAGRVTVVPFGASTPLYRVSSSLVPEVARGVVVGSTLTPATPGQVLQVDLAGVRVSGVVGAPQPEGIGINSGLSAPLLPTDQATTTCIVSFSRFANIQTAANHAVVQLSAVGPDLIAVPVLKESIDVVQAHLNRPARFLPLLLGILGGLIAGIVSLLRAGELATYRLSGSSALSVAAILGFESLILGGAVGVSAALSTLVLVELIDEPWSALLKASAIAGSYSLVAVAFSVIIALRKPNELAKDR